MIFRCLEAIELVEKPVPFGVVLKPCQPWWPSKSTPEKLRNTFWIVIGMLYCHSTMLFYVQKQMITKNRCKCFGVLLVKTEQSVYPPKTSKNFNHQHSIHFLTTMPCFKKFPPNPSSKAHKAPSLSCAFTAALASRSRSTTPSAPYPAARSSGVAPQSHGPRPSCVQNPTERRGKNSQKMWAPQETKR